MANELGSRPLVAPLIPAMPGRARFRVYSVACPKCGRVVWFTLFSQRSPEEVQRAMREQEKRLAEEPCERHAPVEHAIAPAG